MEDGGGRMEERAPSVLPPPSSLLIDRYLVTVTGACGSTTAALADTRAAQDRKSPVVNARMRRCTNAVSTVGRLLIEAGGGRDRDRRVAGAGRGRYPVDDSRWAGVSLRDPARARPYWR